MKIAFATNDRKTIAMQTGRAKEFAVYELSAYKVLNIEYFENNHDHSHHEHSETNHDHHTSHSHKEIIDKLKGVDYIYLKHLGAHLKENIEEAGINYEFTDEEEILNVVKDFFHERSA